jgi:hypothetical protein
LSVENHDISENYVTSISADTRQCSACYLLRTGFFLGLFLYCENGGNTFLRNVGSLSTDYTAFYPEESYPPLREPQILYITTDILTSFSITLVKISVKFDKEAHFGILREPTFFLYRKNTKIRQISFQVRSQSCQAPIKITPSVCRSACPIARMNQHENLS